MGGDCGVVRKEDVAKTFLMDFGLRLEPTEVEEFAIRSGPQIDAFSRCSESVFQENGEKYSKQSWGKNAALLHSALDLKVSDVEPSKTTVPVISS